MGLIAEPKARVCTIKRFPKILLMLAATSLLLISPVHAETKIDRGIKAGISLSKLSGEIGNGAESSPKVGTLFGAFMVLHINEKLAVQSELVFITKGFRREVSVPVFDGKVDFIETAKLTYLEIPILLQLPFPNHDGTRPSLFIGPAIGLGLWGTNKGTYTASGTTTVGDGSFEGDIGNLKRLDFSIVVGGALGFGGEGRVMIDVRYAFGLTNAFGKAGRMSSIADGEAPLFDLNKDEALALRNNTFSISFRLRLGQE